MGGPYREVKLTPPEVESNWKERLLNWLEGPGHLTLPFFFICLGLALGIVASHFRAS